MSPAITTWLAGKPDWDPLTLTKVPLTWPPPPRATAHLRDLTAPLLPRMLVDRGTPVITPAGIDRVRGGVALRSRGYGGAAFMVGESERGLRPGDVLVPLEPNTPPLLLDTGHVGSIASSAFLALRPQQNLNLWIWAVLTSRSGITHRRHAAISAPSPVTRRAALIDLKVPLPSASEAEALQQDIRQIAVTTLGREQEAPGTWWRVAPLSPTDWAVDLATPDPQRFVGGVPLGDLCREVRRGRHAPKDSYRDSAAKGLYPLMEISVLNGGTPRRWVGPESRPVFAKPGDLLAAAAGERPHAAIATEPSALHANVYAISLRDSALSASLAQYLNGDQGRTNWQRYTTGGYIPHMRTDYLAQLPIPPEVLDKHGGAEAAPALSDRLERLLWT